ncbi:hypothetical protein L9W92_17535 [Pelotomaculum terephthalicicum JT]|uniref:hypothetical protein n=1 Tax=Pelotomaculum TaxID=191373 RepID=UPI0009D0BC4B|nr:MULTISPECIES: hypothetical protein [Pelotomaculum]MCG9969806.1 hypothetical protein [Pelotomaculum terephthalicicum JT]OPX85765.1 MAG: hypothetical protein A4E54_02234 [Pelotomaculum sp. PtaB.Bin117]OPY59875.1 MAG: hypothetical protein A4E56_03051 [Pelotomaculum sp. PtaU1.Bin065]
MAWVSGAIEFEKPSENQRHFEGNIVLKKVDDLVLHGVVMETEGKKPVPGALVMVYARINGGKEEPLCHTFSTSDGYYLLQLDKNRISEDTTAIIVRASANDYSSVTV